MTAPWDRRSDRERDRVTDLGLAGWLPAAVSFSAFWSATAADAGLEPSGLTDRHALDRLPPVRELDIAEAGGPGAPGLVMRPTEEQVKGLSGGSMLWSIARAIRGGGSDGKRRAILREYKPVELLRGGLTGELAVAHTRSDLDRLQRTGARAAAVLGLTDADYVVNALPGGPTSAFWGAYHLALGASMLAVHPRGHDDGLDAVAAAFRLAPVTCVIVAPGDAVELAQVLRTAGVGCPRVDTIVLAGPPPDPDTRAEIERAWRDAGANENGLVMRVLWAPPGVRAAWAECRQGGGGLHTYPDLEVLEMVDPVTGERVEEAADGELAYTSLGWHGTALLRWRTGTYVEQLTTEPCPGCERRVPRLAGEVEPDVWQPLLASGNGTSGDGARGDDLRPADLRGAGGVLEAHPDVITWRVEVQPPPARQRGDRIYVEVAGELDDAVLDELREQLRAATGVEPGRIEPHRDPATVDARADELGSVFADVR